MVVEVSEGGEFNQGQGLLKCGKGAELCATIQIDGGPGALRRSLAKHSVARNWQ